MIVTIHQPEHLPWLGFFDKMRQADVFVLLDTTQYCKGDFQNRNRIKTSNGPVWLTVPVMSKGASQQLIEDVRICNDENWRNRCWDLIYRSYRTAPYFAQHKDFFKDLYAQEWGRLVDLNVTIIRYLADALKLKAKILAASELGVYERGGTNVNLAISRHLAADTYLSGQHGKDYLDETRFAEHDIAVMYQEFEHPVYPQLWGDFRSHLSAIDLLFNCGDASLDVIARANQPKPQVPREVAA